MGRNLKPFGSGQRFLVPPRFVKGADLERGQIRVIGKFGKAFLDVRKRLADMRLGLHADIRQPQAALGIQFNRRQIASDVNFQALQPFQRLRGITQIGLGSD